MFMFSGNVFADYGDTTLKKGMNHPDVKVLQENLSKLGYFNEDGFTNYFGAVTEAAVVKFQKEMSINDDGVAGKSTIALIKTKIKQLEILPSNYKDIKIGDIGSSVEKLQKMLADLKLYSDEINSNFDKNTEAAILEFQKNNSLEQTGIVDYKTMMKLKSLTEQVLEDRANESRKLVRARIVSFSKEYLGKPYVWGASSGKAFDCSGFTMYLFKKFNISLDHTATSQFNSGAKVEKSKLMPGDLVFFTTYKAGPSHVGMYIGNNKFIHASSGEDKVTISSLDQNYYSKRYLGARRYNISLGEN